MTSEAMLDAIYEASVFPERWDYVLEKIAVFCGARGGNLIHANSAGVRAISSPSVREATQKFAREGWNENNPRVGRLLQYANHPSFVTDRDIFTADEMLALPVYRDFLTPSGADAGAATLIHGNAHDAVVITMEIFPSHHAASASVAALDRLRPHIARSVMIGSQIAGARNANLLTAFELIGLPVCLLGSGGRIIAASSHFAAHFDHLLRDGPKRLHIIDAEGDARLARELRNLEIGGAGASVAVRNSDMIGQGILHLVPAKLDARDLFSNLFSFAILVHPENRALPGTDLITALFDLTPTEAKVARGIASGKNVSELACEWRLSDETIKSHLKKVFLKTSTRRQGDLMVLLSKFSSP